MKTNDIHIMEALGNAKITVINGKVISISKPEIKTCPLFLKHRNIVELNEETIKKNIEFRIQSFGLFTKDRVIEEKEQFVSFGTSEIFMTALGKKMLDAVVIVSDCTGTLITPNPYLVQGLCGRISGIVQTTPIKEVIERVNIANPNGAILDEKTAEIDQVKGVLKAIEMGFKKIGVSVAYPEQLNELRQIEKDYNLKHNDKEPVKICIFGVHTTGVDFYKYKDEIPEYDLIASCASKSLYNLLKNDEDLKKVLKVQAGKSVPIYALSNWGRDLLLERFKELNKPIYIITNENLPEIKEMPQ
ncbi:methanogenesis marker 8 protein [Methanococcus voltae]|uniref:Methanogenesis marker protein 8 n=1 Tax=Methanococcus voltae (strain ATCC BAA-1334 / A3) TaxID=456320 RepID=D7DUV9_METV3|nr:methanogenesis marker 8 protein [Methanococcus voltae]MCS3900721.1 putative methanogenesis marker protein 8 [Methanococcus voltae]